MTTLALILPARGVPHDVQYYLDEAAGVLNISPAAHFWAMNIWPHTGRLVDGLDSDVVMPIGTSIHDRLIAEGWHIENAFRAWFRSPKFLPEQKFLCAAAGMDGMHRMISETCGYMADVMTWFDYPEGYDGIGAIAQQPIPGRTLTTVRRKGPVRLFDLRELLPEIDNNLAMIRRVTEIWAERPPIAATEIDVTLERPRPMRANALRRAVYLVEPPRQRRARHKRIRRSVAALARHLPADDVKLFLGRESLTLGNDRLTLRVRRQEHLNTSHGGLNTRVLVGGRVACGLCLYTPDVPVADHLTSLILHLRAGLEDEIIETANVTFIREEFTGSTGLLALDAKIAEKRKSRRRVRKLANAIRLEDRRQCDTTRAQAKRRIAGYLIKHGHIPAEALIQTPPLRIHAGPNPCFVTREESR